MLRILIELLRLGQSLIPLVNPEDPTHYYEADPNPGPLEFKLNGSIEILSKVGGFDLKTEEEPKELEKQIKMIPPPSMELVSVDYIPKRDCPCCSFKAKSRRKLKQHVKKEHGKDLNDIRILRKSNKTIIEFV
ncbi:MAG: C2H2-type zinc finger protein [Candidatus Lokiarchaeota archaeon]|nr:C2H2-type zinc finger protein [Candidatus Lokiarchaeota archaeon]